MTFSAADRDGASRQLPDFSAVEQAVLRTLPRNRRPRLISARIEPDSEASFLFATAASPLPPATAAEAQRAVAAFVTAALAAAEGQDQGEYQ